MNHTARRSGTTPPPSSLLLATVCASLLWLGLHVFSVSSSATERPTRTLLVLAADSILILLGSTWIARLVRRSGTLFALASIAFVWTSAFVFSFLAHRIASTSTGDQVLGFISFATIPESIREAGLRVGPLILAAIVLSSIGTLVSSNIAWPSRRSISVSRPGSPADDSAEPGRNVKQTPADATSSRITILLSMSLGLVMFGPSIFDLLARQHVERAMIEQVSGAVSALEGPMLPTFLWTVTSSALLGILCGLPISWLLVARRRIASEDPVPSRMSQIFSKSATLPGVWLIAFAFWVRLATLLTVAPTRTDGGDPLFYHVTANLLAQGRGFPEPLNFIAFQRWIPSALHGPAYPIVLSISSRLGGTTYFDHKFVSVLIGTAVVAMTMVLTRLVAPSHLKSSSMLIAGFLASLYPNLWLVDSVLFPEGLMALLTISVVYFTYRWWNRPRVLWALAAGALIGASALTRGEGLLLAVLLVLPLTLLARHISWRHRLYHLAAAALACLVVIAPWSIRNARSFEVFVPLSTNGNELFVYANCPPVYQGKFVGFWLFQCQEDLRSEFGEPEGDEAEKSVYWRSQGLEYARKHASELPKVLAARIGRQWDLFRPWQNTEFAPIEGRNKDAARIGLFFYYAMLPAGAAGVALLRRSRVRLLPIAAVFASVTLTAAYAYGTTRFRVPAEPLLCLLAAVGAAAILARIRLRWPPSSAHVRFNLLGRSSQSGSFVEGADIDWKRIFRRSSRANWISVGVVGGAIGVTLPALYRSVGSSMEEGFMLVFPELVSRGFVPNVDFLHLYGPGSLHALAGWFHLFGVSLAAERSFGLVQHLLFVSALMLITRPWGRTASTLVGLVSLLFVLTPIGLQALAWNGALGLAAWSLVFSLRARSRNSTRSWALAGISAGLALTFRPDVVLALALGSATLLWRQDRRRILGYTIGVSIGLVPIWMHLSRAGPRAVFEGMFLDPVVRLRGGRELPRPPSLDRLDGALQVISEKFAPWWGFPHLSAPKQLFLWFFLLPLIAVAILLVARSMGTFRSERPVLVASSLFGLGLLPQALQRPDSAHFLWVSAFSWPLIIVASLEYLRKRHTRSHPRFLLATSCSLVVLLLAAILPFYTVRTYADLAVRSLTGRVDVREVRRNDRVFYLGDERPWRATLEVVKDLNSLARPGERLFVGPVDLRQTAYSDVFFYHLFPELPPATYFIEMDPGIANDDPRLAEDVASADWLILTRFWSGWIEPNESVHFGSDLPNQIVEQSFCLVKSYQYDLVRLLRRCESGDGIGPYEGPYSPEHDYAVEVLVPVPPRPDGTCTPTCNGKPSTSGIELGIDTSELE